MRTEQQPQAIAKAAVYNNTELLAAQFFGLILVLVVLIIIGMT